MLVVFLLVALRSCTTSQILLPCVNTDIKLEEFKEHVCKEWKHFTPLGITFFFRESGKDFPLDCDYSLQSLISIRNSRQKTSVDVYLQVVRHAASSSSSSREESSISSGSISMCSSKNNRTVAMYLEDKSKPVKPLLSDGWPMVLGEIGHIFVERVIQVRDAFTKYRLRTGFEMIVKHNERSRFTAKCADGKCGWKFHAASIDERNKIFQVITYNPEHICGAGGAT